MRMIRLGLRIAGKDGSIRSPLHDGTLVGNPDVRGSFNQPSRSGAGEVAIRPSVVRSIGPDGRERAQVWARREEFAEILAKIEQRAQQRGEKIRVIEEWETVVKGPVVSTEMSVNPMTLLRPLLKIAYEIATDWLGPTYADDPTATALRRAICTGLVENIDVAVGYFPPRSAFAEWALSSVSHAAAMWAEGGHGYVAIRIFNVIEAQVRITDALADYDVQPPHWIVLDPLKASVRTGPGVPAAGSESTASISWAEVATGVFDVRTFYQGLETTRSTLSTSDAR